MIKNIYILPTDKPSFLYKTNNIFYIEKYPDKTVNAGNQNIYITSDEEIKEGDYFYQEFDSIIHKCYKLTDNYVIAEKPSDYPKKICRKIILTTDQDLIKNGVQAIDDEFLKWFVNNLSCEEVETFIDTMGCTLENCDANPCINYKIIIPKEKSKLTKEFQKCIDFNDKIYNKETLEEAAEKACPMFNRSTAFGSKYPWIPQKERNAFIKGAKWQQERSYSEEEVLELLKKFYQDNNFNGIIVEWFKQFKKK